uniref:Vacuolar protein sortingassociated protein putative n=1 Tax=Albugo laibachii Nc14 TaxID=890382 RepID=F0W4K4_9STRA|nr:vacuolar protein sortingassociated protein putative [Albugo laibachii Nc14]|eukprot:CCA16037.1 vacuolar protein sortingassociated protein putative [Albugo laibachii Nc14]
MLQHAIALLLQRLLGKFFSFDSSMLRLSLWQGDLAFQDLELKMAYGRGVIGDLSIRIPWRALWTQSVVIRANRIRIFLHSSSSTKEKDHACSTEENVLAHEDPKDKHVDAGDESTYISRLVTHIISNVQIECQDIEVRYECLSESASQPPGAAVFELSNLTLINTNLDWELMYSLQSNSSLESRKVSDFLLLLYLLILTGAAIYVEYRSEKESTSVKRKYLAHDWSSDAALSYPNANAAFCDVDLTINIYRTRSTQNIDHPCQLCDLLDLQNLSQPWIHMTHEHIDVFSAILMEVRAPFDEYERFTELSMQRNISRPEGFLMVLTYAKQWLLADCVDDRTTSPQTQEFDGMSDDNDDEDVFEDAVTPPTLTIRATLKNGVAVHVFSRRHSLQPNQSCRWTLKIGPIQTCIKQSCIEDEIEVQIDSLHLVQWNRTEAPCILLEGNSVNESGYLFRVECLFPANDMRVTGHPSKIRLEVPHSLTIVLSDETLTLWKQLLEPIFLWWKNWNRSHPSKFVQADTSGIEAMSDLSIQAARLNLFITSLGTFAFSVLLDQLQVITNDAERVGQFERLSLISISYGMVGEVLVDASWLLQQELRKITELSRCTWVTKTKHLQASSKDKAESNIFASVFDLASFDVAFHIEQVDRLAWMYGKWESILQLDSPESVNSTNQVSNFERSFSCRSCSLSIEKIDGQSIKMDCSAFQISNNVCSEVSCVELSLSSARFRVNQTLLVELPASKNALMLHLSRRTAPIFASTIELSSSGLLYEKVTCTCELTMTSLVVAVDLACFRLISSVWKSMKTHYTTARILANRIRKIDITQTYSREQLTKLRKTIIDEFELTLHFRNGTASIMHSQLENDHPTAIARVHAENVTMSWNIADRSIQGSIHNITIRDLTHPTRPMETDMVHRIVFGSRENANNIKFKIYEVQTGENLIRVQLFLDSVKWTYLHRVLKQFQHFFVDHCLLFIAAASESISTSDCHECMEAYSLDLDELPGTLSDCLGQIYPAKPPSNYTLQIEMLAHDLTYSLPESSFSKEEILLHATTARMWTANVSLEASQFLQTGQLVQHVQSSTLNINRRDLERQACNLGARLSNYRSQVLIDLKAVTQRVKSALHKHEEVDSELDRLARELHAKVIALDRQLDQVWELVTTLEHEECLNVTLESVKEALQVIENDTFLLKTATKVKLTYDLQFELVNLSGSTTSSIVPLFHRALATGWIMNARPHLEIGVHIWELAVASNQFQYKTLLSILFENFKEIGSVVMEDTYPLCQQCNGHHWDFQSCASTWLQVVVCVADAGLRLASQDYALADIFMENFELSFTMQTDDSMEIAMRADTVTVVDIRPATHSAKTELVGPLGCESHALSWSYKASWTTSHQSLAFNQIRFVGVVDAYIEILNFFQIAADVRTFSSAFLPLEKPRQTAFHANITVRGCLYALLEDFTAVNARALMLLSDISMSYFRCERCEEMPDTWKWHLNCEQRGIYIAQLPDADMNVSFPLTNPFAIVIDHIVENRANAQNVRRHSFVLEPLEMRFSVQDLHLFINIINNYSSAMQTRLEPLPESETASISTLNQPYASAFVEDKLLGDIGQVRLVLVNNSLGIPIADVQVAEVVCEHLQHEECTTVLGAIMSVHFFNNSIYRWEPLMEPVGIQIRVIQALQAEKRMEMYVNVPSPININVTPAMAPIITSKVFQQADFVTTGSKSTAPFWIQNKTGMDVECLFRRGNCAVIEQSIQMDDTVGIDCREQGSIQSFDHDSDRIFSSDTHTATVHHTLFVCLPRYQWTSAYSVIVDVVGHVSIPLEGQVVDENDADVSQLPVLVAEISIQADGSKLINLHSQIAIQNRTCVPLMMWAFAPRFGGGIREWILDREEVCYVPMEMIHAHSKISIRPCDSVAYAPLAASLEELGDHARVVKTYNTKRFIRSGTCTCHFQTADEKNTSDTTLPGFVERDLPPWQCTYDVEAYYLMRAIAPRKKALSTLAKSEAPEQDFSTYAFNQEAATHVPLEAAIVEEMTQQRHCEATHASLYHLSISPFITLFNHLATAVAYRLLNRSLQLVAEGVLAVGTILPLFQIDSNSNLFLSFRLENYNWSAPQSIHPNAGKKKTVPIDLLGRVFDGRVGNEQATVPAIQLQLKVSGRDLTLYCAVWIVNHTDLNLEYCYSPSSSFRRLDNVQKYFHAHMPDTQREEHFSTQIAPFFDSERDPELSRLEKHKPATSPVAFIVVIQQGRNLYRSQAWGLQSPYVRVSLYTIKKTFDQDHSRSDLAPVCSAMTRPSPSGGVDPEWDHRLQNTLMLAIPPEVETLEHAILLMEVRNVKFGMDSCLGIVSVSVDKIFRNRAKAAEFNWYKVIKQTSARNAQERQAGKHCGDLCASISVGMTQQLATELNISHDEDEDIMSPSIYEDSVQPALSPRHSQAHAEPLDRPFPALHPSRWNQTPGSILLPRPLSSLEEINLASTRVGPTYLPDIMTSRILAENTPYDPLSTRMGRNFESDSPAAGKTRSLRVYLPHNRFAHITISVNTEWPMTLVFESVCVKCGVQGIFDIEEYDFYELELPRFISLRSAGRPEGERWYGARISMNAYLGHFGSLNGLHLCHKIAKSTIRLYDESSTASVHHVTPRALLSKQSNPAQHRAVPWNQVLLYGSGGRNWDVLRVRTQSSCWSETIRLKQNALGNSGVAQVITLTTHIGEMEEGNELVRGHQELALWTSYGSGKFIDTIVATIVPRYILVNRTLGTIKYRQADVPHTFQLEPNAIRPFHWPSATKLKLLQVSLLHQYTWSGSFRIRAMGTTYLKLRDSNERARIYILQCQVEIIGGSAALIFREESKRFPPYRIDNMTSFRIQYRQNQWGTEKDFDELLPRSSCPYSWDRLDGDEKGPMSVNADTAASTCALGHSLCVRFMRVTSSTTGLDSERDVIEAKEYNLDEMTTHRRIQLSRSLPSELFIAPEYHGYLYRRDGALKWSKKYFRLYDHMLYYFNTRSDQELLGIIDLKMGLNVPGSVGVTIVENADDKQADKGGSGIMSLNGWVTSISDTLFGPAPVRRTAGNEETKREASLLQSAREQKLRTYQQLLAALCTSEQLQEASTEYTSRHGVQTNAPMYVNGQTLVEFLKSKKHLKRVKALEVATRLMRLGLLSSGQTSPSLSSFVASENAWYSVQSPAIDDRSLVPICASRKLSRAHVRSKQFSIVTPTKAYDLKAPTLDEARKWLHYLQTSTDKAREDCIDWKELKQASRSSKEVSKVSTQSAKTFVHVRIRADGPTKVLELFEGGEEDFDEKESKHELRTIDSCASSCSSPTEVTNGFGSRVFLQLRTEGIGISCVNEIPMELVYIFFGGVSMHYARSGEKMCLQVTMNDFEADNQSNEATFIKLLCPRRENQADKLDRKATSTSQQASTILSSPQLAESLQATPSNESTIFVCADCHYRQANLASVHFCCTWSNEQGTTAYFEHCSFWLYPMIVQLDEELLHSSRMFLNAILSDPWSRKDNKLRHGEICMKIDSIEIMTEALVNLKESISSEELDPLNSLSHFTAPPSEEMQKVYFALLHIHPIEIDITFRSDVFQASASILLRDSTSFQAGLTHDIIPRSGSTSMEPTVGSHDKSEGSWMLPNLSMHIPDLDNAPVRLNALMIEHAFGTSGDLTRRVSKYYTRQLWKQLHVILGSFDFLGNPVGFLDHIGTGVRDFVYEPLDGLKVGAKGFRLGVAKGTASLVSNTLDGTFDAASKISGTFGQGLATMSMDDHYQQTRARARRHHVRSIREGLIQGSKELSLGLYEGVAGLVLGPVRGTRENGTIGFVKGTITGIIGLPVKPVAGIFDFASRASQGVRNRSYHERNKVQRIRKPRVFGRCNELKCYKEVDVIAHELLRRTGGNKLMEEKILFYFEITQRVSADEFVWDARTQTQNADTIKDLTSSFRRTLEEAEEKKEDGVRKLQYEVEFSEKRLGLELESDFYCENVTIKCFDASATQFRVKTELNSSHKVLQNGDFLIGVCGVDVRGIGFHETMRLLRGASRPIILQFESLEECVLQAQQQRIEVAEDLQKVDLTHWIIVTEERALYIEVGMGTTPVVNWTTPLCYIYRVEHIKGSKICLHLSVGVDSLPTGPRLHPTWKSFEAHQRHMQIFSDTMRASFGSMSAIADEQELWPSDTSLNGYLLKKSGFTSSKRWFVLSRNCLYYFTVSKELRGIIPLGNVRFITELSEPLTIRIRSSEREKGILSLAIDNGQVIQKIQNEIVLVAGTMQEMELWQSSLAHAAGKGLRHSRGKRFFVPTAASKLEIGCRETPDFISSALTNALRKTVEVFLARKSNYDKS